MGESGKVKKNGGDYLLEICQRQIGYEEAKVKLNPRAPSKVRVGVPSVRTGKPEAGRVLPDIG